MVSTWFCWLAAERCFNTDPNGTLIHHFNEGRSLRRSIGLTIFQQASYLCGEIMLSIVSIHYTLLGCGQIFDFF